MAPALAPATLAKVGRTSQILLWLRDLAAQTTSTELHHSPASLPVVGPTKASEPDVIYGQNTELYHTGNVEGISIDVYRNYWRKDGKCLCPAECDCARGRGWIREHAPSYQATAMRGRCRPDGRPYKLCPTIQAAFRQFEDAPPLPR